jgi:hypothetical protein
LNLRGGSATAEVTEAPEKVEVCDAAKQAATDAEKYVKEQLDFWNSLTPEQVVAVLIVCLISVLRKINKPHICKTKRFSYFS